MEQYTEYLLKVSLGLALEYAFYRVFLSRMTYYQWNRVYLIVYAAMAFVIPLIDVGTTIKYPDGLASPVVTAASLVPLAKSFVSAYPDGEFPSASHFDPVYSGMWAVSMYDLLLWIYIAGILVFVGRLVFGLIAVMRLMRRSSKIQENGLSLYVCRTNIAPFSFGKNVFFDEGDYSSKNKDVILMHEEVHVKQGHSVDTLFAELLVAFNWYNPFAWLIRRAIRQNLEFIADNELLNRGIEPKKYQYILLELAGYTPYFFGNQFTFSSLKDRIRMMNGLRSGRIHLAKFLFLVPVFSVSLMMCQKSEVEDDGQTTRQNFKVLTNGHNADVFAGIIVDAQTLQPIDKFRMKLTKSTVSSSHVVNGVEMRVIGNLVDSVYVETDSDGFYYWKNPSPSEKYDYSIEEGDPRYNSFSCSTGSAIVSFVLPISMAGRSKIFFLDNGFQHFENAKQNKDFLLSGSQDCMRELKLISDFKKTRFHSGKLITHFRNAYFDSEDQLMGYEGKVDFYLDGEKTTYEELNRTFEWEDPAIKKNVVPSMAPLTRLHREYSYYAAPLSRDVAPSKNLVTAANFEWISGFDISRLDSEPYYVDGFRQIKGIGSNLKPEPYDIKRVALLKGKLARYYNSRLDRILWVETRPKNEIVGRPEF
jgi:beta-lactamase regulating signal transducer with metallopeptidase domain